MTTPRINLKSIDYFKFKKLVIDGNRDDYTSCSKEVKTLCDCVQTLNFRDEEFDDESDRGRFQEVCLNYKQILASKRIDPLDMRIKSGWWGDHKNAYSAGKIKPQELKQSLVSKVKSWMQRHGTTPGLAKDADIQAKMEGPGLYVFKHKEHQCFQFVGRADKIFSKCAEKLKASFEGSLNEPLAALLVISMGADWDFYFIPIAPDDKEGVLRVMENDLILKHDCIWPHGLNFRLHIDSLLEVSEFRKSCLRHSWPPEGDAVDPEINLKRLRDNISHSPGIGSIEASVSAPPQKPKQERSVERKEWVTSEPSPPEEEPERPLSSSSGESKQSSGTVIMSGTPAASPSKPKPSAGMPRPASAKKAGDRPMSASTKALDKAPGAAKAMSKSAVGSVRPTTPKRRPGQVGKSQAQQQQQQQAQQNVEAHPQATIPSPTKEASPRKIPVASVSHKSKPEPPAPSPPPPPPPAPAPVVEEPPEPVPALVSLPVNGAPPPPIPDRTSPEFMLPQNGMPTSQQKAEAWETNSQGSAGTYTLDESHSTEIEEIEMPASVARSTCDLLETSGGDIPLLIEGAWDECAPNSPGGGLGGRPLSGRGRPEKSRLPIVASK